MMKKILILFTGILASACNWGNTGCGKCSCESGCCDSGSCPSEDCICDCKN